MIGKCKILLLASLILLIISLTSCGHIPENYLLYQNFPLEFDAVMTFGGNKYEVYMVITDIGEGSVIYKTPLTLSGYRYDIVDNEITISYEQLVVQLTAESFHPVKTAVNLFTLIPDEMKTAAIINHGGVKLNHIEYERNDGIITVWSTSDNIPIRIESNLLSLDITNFRGNMHNE